MTTFRLTKGLTLIELCVALLVMATIALSVASVAPSMIHTQRADAAIKELRQLFRFARTEAITRTTIVTICPLDAANQCSNDWHRPISVFRDPDNSRALSQGEVIIKQLDRAAGGVLRAAPAQRRYFQFDALGGSKGTLGNLTYCPTSGDPRFIRRLIVSFPGRTRLAQDTDLDGQVEDAQGKPITCD
ncbi:GspH/FimT family pseudopilin [Marinobacter sp. X15-166B]|uniref:GspH/FimT family pseudopilin n=1 Tax=Marinobacter sp. X15-166B TaxID=1897620 RepID=UPI00085C8897|nr:GspH/FimT family pseudopilin [Marinobacter sp. X15-166B]OEY66661.1 hypothetical protein BG841_09490 [Marinobacter sp. X15-166B]